MTATTRFLAYNTCSELYGNSFAGMADTRTPSLVVKVNHGLNGLRTRDDITTWRPNGESKSVLVSPRLSLLLQGRRGFVTAHPESAPGRREGRLNAKSLDRTLTLSLTTFLLSQSFNCFTSLPTTRLRAAIFSSIYSKSHHGRNTSPFACRPRLVRQLTDFVYLAAQN